MPAIITLRCPARGAQIDIPENNTRFTCAYCGNQHLLQFNVQPVPAAQPDQKVIRPRIPKPEGVRITRSEKSARIERRWWTPALLFMAVFTLVWDGFLLFWFGAVALGGAPLIFSLFPLVHVAVGVFLTYSTLAGFVNRTIVELTRDELAVWHEPLPWPGERTLKTADIKQLYCKESVRHSKNGARFTYALCAVTQDNTEVKLLSNLTSPELARFFEQQLETWLRISDRPVLGELPK